MSIEAMKQALEALLEINELSKGENAICLPAEIDGAMDALRTAIEQAEKQEPVGEVVVESMSVPGSDAMQVRIHFYKEIPPVGSKVYTAPPAT